MATIDDVKATYLAVNRVELNDTAAAAVAAAIDGGTLGLTQYRDNLIAASTPTTVAAVAVGGFITGSTPTSAQVTALTEFAKTQNDYYTNVLKSDNAQLGAYEALGKAFAADPTTSADFAARYGVLSTADFVSLAYSQVFDGTPPSAGAAANLTAQVTYFTDLYVAAGIPAAQASLQAKGAVLGQIIGYAAFNTDPALSSALITNSGTRIAGFVSDALNDVDEEDSTNYDSPLTGLGNQITVLGAGAQVSLDLGTGATNKASVYADTVTGLITGDASINTAAGDDLIGTTALGLTITQGVGDVIKIDGSAGNDTLYAVLGSDIVNTGTTTTFTVANVETLNFKGTGAFDAIDAGKITGANEIWSYKTDAVAGLTVSKVADGVTVGVQATAASANFAFADDVTTGSLALKGVLAGGTVTVGGADVETVNVSVVSNSITKLAVGAKVETVNVSGAGELALQELSGTIKTFDASANTAKISVGSTTAFAATLDETSVTLTGGNDSIKLSLLNDINVTVATGNGSDNILLDAATLKNISLDGTTIATLATVSDFKVGSDKFTMTGTYDAFLGDLTGQATLETALAIVETATTATNYTLFEYGGSSYIFQADGVAGLTTADGLVKISGVTGLSYDAGIIS
jgi:hypothetical protein